MKVMEEVMDTSTLMTLYDLMNSQTIRKFYGVISSGKESRIYYATTGDGAPMAVKIYLVESAEFKRNRLPFVANDPRFKRVPADFRRFIDLWAQREFRNLVESRASGVPVPKPYFVRRNVLGMEFIGLDGQRYPLLSEAELDAGISAKLYDRLLDIVGDMYSRAGLVHGDLSQFNVMVTDTWDLYIIDLAQAVTRRHPLAEGLLRRGLETLNKFFARKGVEVRDAESILAEIQKQGET